MATETITVATDFTPLDLLLWRRFRSEAPGRVERTIELNRHICDFIFLPIGTVVTVELPEPRTVSLPKVQLWS